MYHRLPTLVVLAATLLIGCERRSAGPTSPAAAEGIQPAISVEPLSVHPEFLATPSCVTRPAFGVRLSILLRSHGPFVRGLRFRFLDRFGRQTLPEVTLMSSLFPTTATLPTPSTLPSSSPMPIPGVAPLPSVAPSSGILPFFVRFGCDVFPDGTLIIGVNENGHDGNEVTSELRVRVGS